MYRLTVGLPATPCFGQMLQDSLCLVLLDRFRHHVKNIVHHGCTELKVVVRLDPLLRHSLRNALAVSSFELTRKQVAKPAQRLQPEFDVSSCDSDHAPSLE